MNEIEKILDKLYLRFEDAGLTTPEYSDLRHYVMNLQSKIDKAIELNENIRKKLLTCSSYEKDKVEDLLFEQLDILKEDK